MDINSFSVGFTTGLMLRWTDLIPIAGGFLLGFSIHQIPDITTRIPDFIVGLYEKIIKKSQTS